MLVVGRWGPWSCGCGWGWGAGAKDDWGRVFGDVADPLADDDGLE